MLLTDIIYLPVVVNVCVFTEQEDGSALQTLDLMFNHIQADGAEVLAKSLQVHIHLK